MRALYVSVAGGETGRSLPALAELLGQAERNNRRDQVTSVLALHDGRFLQAVEGTRADLDRLMARVRRDPRHHGFRLLAYGPVEARAFRHWSMSRADVTGDPLLATGRGLDVLGPVEALALLRRATDRLPVPA